jgi:hypothetical protein
MFVIKGFRVQLLVEIIQESQRCPFPPVGKVINPVYVEEVIPDMQPGPPVVQQELATAAGQRFVTSQFVLPGNCDPGKSQAAGRVATSGLFCVNGVHPPGVHALMFKLVGAGIPEQSLYNVTLISYTPFP